MNTLLNFFPGMGGNSVYVYILADKPLHFSRSSIDKSYGDGRLEVNRMIDPVGSLTVTGVSKNWD